MATVKLVSVFLAFLCISGGVAQNCQVDNISVQSDFDFNQIMGKWYVISWYDDDVTPNSPRLTNYIQNIAQTADNEATIYAQGRSSSEADKCKSTVSFISSPDGSAKLLWTSHNVTSPSWIVDTDYNDYALVYGCYNESTIGSCTGSRAWIWSRSKTLSQSALNRTTVFYTNICLQEEDFETISFDKDCGVITHLGLTSDQDCTINNIITVQENFDFKKYMGTWYEIKWLAINTIPANQLFQDYQHRYVRLENGHVFAYIYGRSPDNIEQCFYNNLDMINTTTPGKFYFVSEGVNYPYWVLKTDYTQYAVVYGCYNVSSNGSCNEARSWIWSRTPTLPDQIHYQVNSFLQTICVNPTAYLPTRQNNSCPLKPIWPINDQTCTVSELTVQSDFDVNKYMGNWYEIQWLALKTIPAKFLFQDYQHRYVTLENGHMFAYIYGRSPENMEQCFYNNLDMINTTTPGKFYYVGEGVDYPYWVLRTDYTQYAVVFGCYNVSSDGSCNEARSWVWSRTPTLPDQIHYQVNSFLQTICVNPTAYLPTEQNNICPLKPIWTIKDQNCNVSQLPAQSDFDVNKFTRVWYGTHWLPEAYLAPSGNITDRQVEVFADSQGGMSMFIKQRSSKGCEHNVLELTSTEQSGKFISKTDSTPFWVAGTDYSNYAVVYTCERVGSDGQCESARGSVWSRSPNLPQQHQYTANSLIKDLCLNSAGLAIITHSNACLPERKEACSTPNEASRSTFPKVISFFLIITGLYINHVILRT